MKLEAPEGLGNILTLEPNRYAKEVKHYKNLDEKLMVIKTKFLIDTHGIFSIEFNFRAFKVHYETSNMIHASSTPNYNLRNFK